MVARQLPAVILALAWVSVAATNVTEEPGSDILTPHGATEPLEAFNVILQSITTELHSPHWQWLVTVIAFCFGVAAVAFPEKSFKSLTAALIFAVMYTVVMGDLHDRYRDQHFEGAIYINGVMLWQIIVSIEAAGCATLIAWKGFEGIRAFLAMVLGVGPLKLLQATLVHSGVFGGSPWWNIIVVSLSALFGFVLMKKNNLELLLSYVFPLFGGKLISCSIGWFLFYMLDHSWSKAYLDFYHSLPLDISRSNMGPSPGIGWSELGNLVSGPPWMGWVVGTVIWFAIALGSIVYHHKQLNKVSNDLNEPLIHDHKTV